jgi:dihydroorotase
MKTLYKSVLIIDPKSKLHGKRRDVVIENGCCEEIGVGLRLKKGTEIARKNLYMTTGWIDSMAHFRDPGMETIEHLDSGCKAAKNGGFKYVVLMPSTQPVIDNKSGVMRIVNYQSSLGVRLLPTGCLSEALKGEQLAEHYDMYKAGAVAFTDDKKSVSSGLMLRALEYVKSFDGMILSFPFDASIAPSGQIHEGATSVRMGLKGIPELTEELRLQRDIELLRYSGSRMHVSLITTSKSVDMIRKAKKEGLRITCGVAAHHLYYQDSDCIHFDSLFKVIPPLRDKLHQKALIQGLKDGTIDLVCSDHRPWDTEHKELEFDDASEGMAGIETAFHLAWAALEEHLELEKIMALFTSKPATIFGIEQAPIGESKNLPVTIFSTEDKTIFDANTWGSQSRFHPLYGTEMKGKIYA